MKLRHSLKTALTGLTSHKSRSALTILGIVIGITSIMLIMSIGQGAENLIVGEISGLGAETIVIRPGKEPSGLNDFADLFFADSLKERELTALKKRGNVPDLVSITPEVIVVGNASYAGKSFKPIILGFDASFLIEAFDLELKEGIAFDDVDIKSRARVILIGTSVNEELFGEESGLGKNIKIKGEKFRVIGIFSSRGQVAFFNIDDIALIPYSTAQTYLTGQKHYTQMIAKASSPEAVDRTVYDIEQTLRELHNITDPANDDFHVDTQQGLVGQVTSILNILTMFLSAVVAIALVVGGIGVMNIMLVSVTERTKEIGLRKAIGATEKDILTQFLLEAVILTGLGGLIGIFLGAGLSFLTAFILSNFGGLAWEFQFPYIAGLLGVAVSAMVGLIFGIYPARNAAKKNPVDALRYE